MSVVRATTGTERQDAFDVRREVFVEGQGVPADLEWDEHDTDPDTVHFVAYDEGDAVGAGRFRPAPDEAGVCKVERVAVLESRRGEGWGRDLMAAIEDAAREAGYDAVTLDAQTHAESFYRRLGYEATSGVFEEAGIPHVAMRKSL